MSLMSVTPLASRANLRDSTAGPRFSFFLLAPAGFWSQDPSPVCFAGWAESGIATFQWERFNICPHPPSKTWLRLQCDDDVFAF